jgi:transglutaminase superfamily protein
MMGAMNKAAAVFGITLGAAAALTVGVVVAGRRRDGALRGTGRARKGGGKMTPYFEKKGAGGQIANGYHQRKMSIKQRLELMQEMVAEDVKDPEMRKLALRVTSKCEARDDECEMRAIYDYVRKNVRYSGDVAPHKLWKGGPVDSVDLYSTGKRTLESGAGDCDDATILVSSLAVLNGITAKFKATSPFKWQKEAYTHVYPMLGYPKNDPEKWIAADTTLPGGDHFGEEHPHAKAFEVIA